MNTQELIGRKVLVEAPQATGEIARGAATIIRINPNGTLAVRLPAQIQKLTFPFSLDRKPIQYFTEATVRKALLPVGFTFKRRR